MLKYTHESEVRPLSSLDSLSLGSSSPPSSLALAVAALSSLASVSIIRLVAWAAAALIGVPSNLAVATVLLAAAPVGAISMARLCDSEIINVVMNCARHILFVRFNLDELCRRVFNSLQQFCL